MFKRISVVFLAVLLVATLLPMAAFAHTICENGHDFAVTESGSKLCNVCDLELAEVSADANGNDEIDEKDAIYLLYHFIFGNDYYPLTVSYDFNLNGKVDANDAIYLLYNITFDDGAEKYPLYAPVDPDYIGGDEIVDEDDKDQGFEPWIPMP